MELGPRVKLALRPPRHFILRLGSSPTPDPDPCGDGAWWVNVGVELELDLGTVACDEELWISVGRDVMVGV